MPEALADKIAVENNADVPGSTQNEAKQCKCGRGPEKYRKDGVSMGLCTECLKERMRKNKAVKPVNTTPHADLQDGGALISHDFKNEMLGNLLKSIKAYRLDCSESTVGMKLAKVFIFAEIVESMNT